MLAVSTGAPRRLEGTDMGLLATLGLHRNRPPVPGGGGPGAPSGARPGTAPGGRAAPTDARGDGGADGADGAGDAVAAELDAIEQLLAGVADEKAKAGLVAELATLRANHEQAEDLPDAGKRAAAAQAAAAAAKKLRERAQKLADADADKRSVSDAKADLDAVVKEIETLVAGIGEAAPKKRLEGELAKLKLAVAKAKQPAPSAVAMKSLAAVTTAAQALRLRADQTKDAVDWANANLKPLDGAAAPAVAALAGTAKGVLQKELDALRAAIAKHLLDGDRASLHRPTVRACSASTASRRGCRASARRPTRTWRRRHRRSRRSMPSSARRCRAS